MNVPLFSALLNSLMYKVILYALGNQHKMLSNCAVCKVKETGHTFKYQLKTANYSDSVMLSL